MAGKMRKLSDVFADLRAKNRAAYEADLAEEEAAGDIRKAARAQELYEHGITVGWWDERGNDLEPEPEPDPEDDEESEDGEPGEGEDEE